MVRKSNNNESWGVGSLFGKEDMNVQFQRMWGMSKKG